jgi:hypothetical protein
LAARESRVLAQGLNHFLNFRDAHPQLAGRFIDVQYQELVADPLEVIRRVYDRFGLPLTRPACERMERLAHQRSRYEHRRTGTAPFDPRPATIAEASCFERYCSRFKVGWRQTGSR